MSGQDGFAYWPHGAAPPDTCGRCRSGHRVVTRLWYDVGMRCEMCGNVIENRMGRVPRFCSSACRQKAYRLRQRKKRTFIERAGDRWVRAAGKRPVMPDGSAASSTDPSTWSPFEAVQVGAGDAVGVMLGGGIGAYDLDHVIVGGELEPWAREFIEAIPEPVLFMEESMSGTGVHVFIEAAEGRGSRHGQVERYTKSRFIRMTFKDFSLRR